MWHLCELRHVPAPSGLSFPICQPEALDPMVALVACPSRHHFAPASLDPCPLRGLSERRGPAQAAAQRWACVWLWPEMKGRPRQPTVKLGLCEGLL